ncbi:MAG: membrane protein insertase YidC [Candidatus Magnetomorum sp.]|nr:membrane protein insertase YidC [Candidatus Magnetomorum sp.]
MEQVRFLLAIALSFLVLFVWQNYFLEKPELPPSDVAENQTIPDMLPEKMPPHLEATKLPAGQPADQEQSIESTIPAKRILVQTPLFDIEFSERGAAIQRIMLVNYKETNDADSLLKQIVHLDDKLGTALISFQNQVIPDLDKVVFQAETQRSIIKVSTLEKLRFIYNSPQGIKVVKTYLFDPASYTVGLNVSIDNPTTFPVGDQLNIVLRRNVPETQGYIFEGPAILLNNHLNEIDQDDIEDKKVFSGAISWAALEDRYFLTAVLPLDNQADNRQAKIHVENSVMNLVLTQSSMNIAPGTQKNIAFHLFLGPKSLDILNGLDNNLNQVINFGWFDLLARPCLYLMNLIYKFIPNYGIAIILLTILIKLLFWPLGNKSYKSMNEMRKLQPMMKKIQEKYKDDRQKLNQELMGLYRTYKVNPLGGCLPMVLQIPVFIALYRMLYQAIELRHAPFFLWINDLSAPDRLFHFTFYVPFMEEPYGIPVLTIIMGATMLIQQKMSPPPGDPNQAKMMMFLPIVFTFIFINFPAGLVLYWLVNNVASILQQYYINKKNE